MASSCPRMTARGEFEWCDENEKRLGLLSVQMSLSVVINAFRPKNDLCVKNGKADLTISDKGWDKINQWLSGEGFVTLGCYANGYYTEDVGLPDNPSLKIIKESDN